MVFWTDLLTAGLRIIMMQTHVTSDTRPSRFSACNTEKLGRVWGWGYVAYTLDNNNHHHFSQQISQIAMNYMDKYFDNPDQFDPGRFAPDKKK